LIALSGLAITGLLTWQGVENDKRQTRLALLALFSDQVNFAIQTCDPDPLYVASDALSQMLATGGDAGQMDQNTRYQDYFSQVTARIDKCRSVEEAVAAGQATPQQEAQAEGEQRSTMATREWRLSPRMERGTGDTTLAAPTIAPLAEKRVTVAQNLDLRLQEGIISSRLGAGVRFYAVLASYKVGEEKVAAEHVVEYMRMMSGENVRLEVFRTQRSNYYAIVLTPENFDRDKARELTSLARKRGWSPDSFIQGGSDWVQCTDPTTAEGLAKCG
jgi:hypothetical protein